MKLTIDLHQSPQALLNDLQAAVRMALGQRFYIEEAEDTGTNFTAEELADPKVNIGSAASASVASLPPIGGAAVQGADATNAATGAGGSVDLDSEGQPYDARIHSAGKSKIQAGTWKLKKGVDQALVAQIKAQNAALLANKAPTEPPPSNVVSLPALPNVAALPTLPPVAQVPAADVEIVVTDYPSFAQYVAQQMAIKPVSTKRELDKGLAHYGILDAQGQPDLTAVAHRPDVIPGLYPWLKAVLGTFNV